MERGAALLLSLEKERSMASGGADIDYYGDPRMLDEDESGSADIRGH